MSLQMTSSCYAAREGDFEVVSVALLHLKDLEWVALSCS